MRIWHKELIPLLPRQQLLGQWRECCLIAKQIAENGAPNHVLVNKVMEYPIDHFRAYGLLVLGVMAGRGYNADLYRFNRYFGEYGPDVPALGGMFAGWHNDRYLRQCLANLQEKADCGAIPAEEWKKIADVYPEWR